jgi:hypothetical protein
VGRRPSSWREDRLVVPHDLSAEDLESIEATLELLTDAEAVRRVEQASRDLAAGRGTSAEQMAELMSARRERGGV